MPPEREYKFVTVWKTDAPLEKVWNEIYHSERWPEWCRGVEEVVEIRKGDELGVGSIRRYTWKSALPYRLSFESETVRVEPMTLLEGIASGELDGRGVWKLHSEGGHTTVVYDWRVKTSKAWMNFLAPIAEPIFKWNHDVVMGWGAKGLAHRLGAAVTEERE